MNRSPAPSRRGPPLHPPAQAIEVLDRSTVGLYRLTVRADGDEHVVGADQTGTFVALPSVGARAIELLAAGTPCDATRQRVLEETGVNIDVVALVRSLIEVGLVRTIDGHPVGTAEPQRSHLPRLGSHHVRWLFSRPALALWALTLAAAAASVAASPRLLPRAQDYFWATTTGLVVLGNAALMTLVMATHELAHLFAARAHDLPARISISHRLVFLVAQTDVSAAWSLPRRSRYRIYLAGMAWDLWLLSLALATQAHLPLPPAARSALQALALLLTMGLLGQCTIYVRTDLYFVLLDLLRCRDLHGDALRWLRWLATSLPCRPRGWRRRDRPPATNPLDALPAHERRAVRPYALVLAAGSAVALATFALFTVPIVAGTVTRGLHTVWLGITANRPGLVADGLIAVGYQAAFYTTLVTVMVRRRTRRRDAGSAA